MKPTTSKTYDHAYFERWYRGPGALGSEIGGPMR